VFSAEDVPDDEDVDENEDADDEGNEWINAKILCSVKKQLLLG
jgi:hypothetical protein